MFWAYLLRCADQSYYAGHTDRLDERIGAHHAGLAAQYTATRRPVALVWSQEFPSRLEALAAERQIKKWSRAKKEALVGGDWDALKRLSLSCASTSSARTVVGVSIQTEEAQP